MNKLKLFNTYISKISFDECVERILSTRGQSSYICFANVHMVMEAYKDDRFNEILKEAYIVTPDGAPIAKTLSWLYNYKQQRIAGMDLLPRLLHEAEKRCVSVFFYGSTEEVLSSIKKKVASELPNLKVAGSYSPPFRQLTETEELDIINRINYSGADLVFVALGCPKQEKWMARHKNKINACMLGVGQAFLVYAELEKRLPKWTRDLCVEWIYRLYLEPGRLWKRYLINNSLFLFRVLKLLFKRRKLTSINYEI